MRTRFFLSFVAILCFGLLIPLTINWQDLHNNVVGDMKEASKREIRLLSLEFIQASQTMENQRDVEQFLSTFASKNVRISFIANDGKVIFDTAVDKATLPNLENHNNRQEVIDAKQYGRASAARYSKTLGIDFVYAAEKIPQTKLFPEGILRIALPTIGVSGRLKSLVYRFFLAGLGVMLLALVLSHYLYKRLEMAIKDMQYVVDNTAVPDPSRRPALPPKPEFKELSIAVANMTQRVSSQLRTIINQKVETESILNSMNAGVMVLGTRGLIIRLNSAFYTLMPEIFTKNPEFYLHKTPLEIFQNPDLQNSIDTFIKSGEKAESLQLPFKDKVFQLNLTKPVNSENKISLDIELVLIFHDITEISKLIDMKRDLIANVSHELRTPLTAIQGYAETMQGMYKNNLDEKAQNFLHIIIKNTRHLDRIVHDLLTLSTLENEQIKIQSSSSLKEALNSALEECMPQLEEKKLVFHNLIKNDITVAIDTDRLSQVFRNIIENAIRYSHEEGSIIIAEKEEYNFCHITVQDTGKGIPLEDISRVFERFYRVEKHRGDTSTGLGLSLCKHILEKYGGSIRAQYKANPLLPMQNHVGATLIFSIPLWNKQEK